MEKYLTYKQVFSQLAEVRTKEELQALCFAVDMSYQHEKITYKDLETFFNIVNRVVKRELID